MLPCCALQELICWELCRLSCWRYVSASTAAFTVVHGLAAADLQHVISLSILHVSPQWCRRLWLSHLAFQSCIARLCVQQLPSWNRWRSNLGNAAELLLTMLHFLHCQHITLKQQTLPYGRYRQSKQPINLTHCVITSPLLCFSACSCCADTQCRRSTEA